MASRSKTDHALARRVSLVTMTANVLLAAFKLLAGLIAHSSAMISDAVHSASDVFTTIIVLIGLRISGREADQEHPYGHERFESVASMVLAFILFMVGLLIGWKGLENILSGAYALQRTPGVLALVAAVVSIVVKEGMYWYTWLAAKKINSTALKADAWHHRSDALSSIGALAGILGARMGLPILDSIASLVICLFILKVAIDIFMEALDKTVDRACDEKCVARIVKTVLAQPGVKTLDNIKTRQFGSAIYTDIEISVDSTLSLEEAHAISERVHRAVEKQTPNLKHCMVHVNPYTADCAQAHEQPDIEAVKEKNESTRQAPPED